MEYDNQPASRILHPVQCTGSTGSPAQVETAHAEPSILVVIANFGTRNDRYLGRLLKEFRAMPFSLALHVLTNIPKDLGPDVTVHVGLPTRNPRSLPFAHRALFAEHLADYDFFIYCEDDTLITEKNIRAFLEVNSAFNPDEIPGFLRVERFPDGECYVESAHGPYRWIPSSLVRRGELTFASFTNVHSAFVMASRSQVQRAIDSNGFLVKPHVGRFGMLECASSDIYTQCGMTRLICVSRIQDFLVPHLSKANSSNWGIPYQEFLAQTSALQALDSNEIAKNSLIDVETRMPRGWWSKNLYEEPDPTIHDLIPAHAKTVLSIGSGWGATEELLLKQGKQVTALPVDAVFGDCLRRRGIAVVGGSFEDAMEKLAPQRFDLVLMQEIIHLLANPIKWLSMLKPCLGKTGALLASVPKTMDPLRLMWYLRGEPDAVFPHGFSKSNVQKVSRSNLRRWFDAAGMTAEINAQCTASRRLSMFMKLRLGDRFLGDKFLVRATPKLSC